MLAGGSDFPGSSETASLRVTGRPPSSGGTWANGIKEVWTVQTAGMRDWSESEGDSFDGTYHLHEEGWTLFAVVGDTGQIIGTLDPNTGRLSWETGRSFVTNGGCATTVTEGLVPCLTSQFQYEEPDGPWRLFWTDWGTGEIKKTVALSELDLAGDYGSPEVRISKDHLDLTLPTYGDYLEDYLGSGSSATGFQGVINARLDSSGTKKLWATRSQGCEELAWETAEPQHGLLFPGYGLALDENTGKEFLPANVCASVAADGVLSIPGSKAAEVPRQLTAPDGTTIDIVTDSYGIEVFGDPLPAPLRIQNISVNSDGSETTAELEAYSPGTGAPLWSQPLPVTGVNNNHSFVGTVTYKDGYLLVSDMELLRSVDPETGEVIWQHQGNDWHPVVGEEGTIIVYPSGDFLDANSIAIDGASGKILWSDPGIAYFAPDPGGGESILVLRNNSVSRLVPADRTTDAPTLPGDAPACPQGMTPVSWTRYEGGSILLCQQDQKFVVITPDQPKWKATELNFVPGGFQAVFGTDATIWVSLGGSAVTVEERGEQTMRPTTTAWTAARGSTDLRLPSDIRQCPAGSWPISLSTFDGGWLLVCGTAASQPTQLIFNDGQIIDSEKVSYHSGTYCADTTAGEVCVHRSPALVTIEGDSAEVEQHSVASNYFSGYGEGGAGTGAGSYGVAAPETNAKDQVRYITEILEKSAVDRADLNEAVSQVRACQDLPGAIRTLEGVTDNRNELLEALDSTPVDAIPGGTQLASQLRRALELSRDSDLVWVEWAESEQANGCALGNDNPLYKTVYNMNLDVALAKDAFVDNWNTNIAPQYGAPQFTRPQI